MVRHLLEAMASKLDSEFFRTVRHLGFRHHSAYSASEAIQLLGLCTEVINFQCDFGFADPTALLPLLTKMRIRRLVVNLERLFGAGPADPAHQLFAHVTHDMEPRVELLPAVPLLPAFTHLAVCWDSPWERLLSPLAECPRLQLLLVKFAPDSYDLDEESRAPYAYDVRFVIGRCADYWADWEVGVRGGSDLWVEGDEFVERKRAGEIETTRYWL
ncbi:hypothetical protein DFH08DRAFT_1087979 [Mycena albidolilacea]|uniref:Uncharacterized protein n=1 Tax=Mycena albidolilacea TaxID=1033008 RepID=A0AAD7ECS6_9AGAR|nr:hypothetical protein DFH08DRAFT_1087979 [Mycena albidolilacea]